MLKKIIISALLATVSIASAQIGIDLDVSIHSEQRQRQIQQTIIVDENVPFVIEDVDFTMHIMVRKVEAGILVETEVFAENDSHEKVLVSSPVILVEFGKTGTIRLGKKTEGQDICSLTLEMRPFVVNQASI